MISRTMMADRLARAAFLAYTKLRYPDIKHADVKITGELSAAMTQAVSAELVKITREDILDTQAEAARAVGAQNGTGVLVPAPPRLP